VVYFWGAACWIINASVLVWPPDNVDAVTWVVGVTSILGALLFHVGACCQCWEALNEDQTPLCACQVDVADGLLVASFRHRSHCVRAGSMRRVKVGGGELRRRQVCRMHAMVHDSGASVCITRFVECPCTQASCL